MNTQYPHIEDADKKHSSEIAYEMNEFDKFAKSSASDHIRKNFAEAMERKNAFVQECKAAGLKTTADFNDHYFNVSEHDDGGKSIITTITVRATTPEEVSKAVQFAKSKRMAVMPIGAKTSAIGSFESAISSAKQNGLQGVMGIEFDQPDSKKKPSLISVENTPTGFTKIEHPELPITILKSDKFPDVPHQVFAHAGVTIADINKFLNKSISSDDHHFRLMPDPTSKGEANLGGNIATGAEGGNRYNPSEDIIGAVIIDGNGDIQKLDSKEAKSIVGLNGAAGMCIEAHFEVTAFPKHEHGMFIPIKGEGPSAWENALTVQNKLKKYCKARNGNPRLQVNDVDDGSGSIITGIEILSSKSIDLAHKKSAENTQYAPAANQLKNLMVGSELGLYITYSSFFDPTKDDKFCQQKILKDLGIDIMAEEVGEEGECIIEDSDLFGSNPPYDRVMPFSAENLKEVDELRHAIATFARERGRELGGSTESTDLNLQLTSDDEEKNAEAIKLLAKIYDKYINQFSDDWFEIQVYGHLHPGSENSGGIDPHIRVSFDPSHYGSMLNSIEQAEKMKKLKKQLYAELLALSGKGLGVEICPPEKGQISNPSYLHWMETNERENLKEIGKTITKYGYSKNAEGNPEYATFAFRSPVEFPDAPEIPGGINALIPQNLVREPAENGDSVGENLLSMVTHEFLKHWQAEIEISQKSHRGPDIKRLMKVVTDEIRKRLNMNSDQYVAFIESPEEAESILERNLGPNHGVELSIRPESILVSGQANLGQDSEKNKATVINLKNAGIPGLSLMIINHNTRKKSADRVTSGENKAIFRNLEEMCSKLPFETFETQILPSIIKLGLALNSKKDGPYSNNTTPLKSVNPGPSETANAIKRDGLECFAQTINSNQATRTLQRDAIEGIKKFMSLQDDSEIAFQDSATQIMQLIAEAIEPVKDKANLMQIVNGPFAARLNDILKSRNLDVETLSIPQTTTPYFELEKIVKNLVSSMKDDKKNIIFLTPHETGTTVNFNPNVLIEELAKRGKVEGKDYELICDVTSSIGAIDYSTPNEDTGEKELRMNVFGSGQKALGLQAGFALFATSKSLTEFLSINDKPFSLKTSFQKTRDNDIENPLALALLHKSLEEKNQKTPEQIEQEIRRKLNMVLGFIANHEGLHTLVQNPIEQSPILVGIFSQQFNLKIVKLIMEEMFNSHIGGGYGPLINESIRTYLANISYEKLRELLVELDLVLKLPDTTETVNTDTPLISLRQVHAPAETIDLIAKEFELDHIFTAESALGLIKRWIITFDANVRDPDNRGKYPTEFSLIGTSGFVEIPNQTKEKAKKVRYGSIENLQMIYDILSFKDNHDMKLLSHFREYSAHTVRLQEFMKENPNAKSGEDHHLEFTKKEIKKSLEKIANLLNLYKNEKDEHGNCKRKRDKDDHVYWPLAV